MPRTALGALAAAIAALALPAAATAEYLIPPDNSAVNQYTESLPTPGGSRDSEKSRRKRRPSPAKTLGADKAQRLKREGPDGRAAAAFAAATAPTVETTVTAEPDEETGGVAPGTGGRGGDGGGAAGQGGNRGDAGGGSSNRTPVDIAEPNGSSGLSEVIGEATGTSSSGQLGILLPLLILGTAIWAIAYARRQRQQAG